MNFIRLTIIVVVGILSLLSGIGGVVAPFRYRKDGFITKKGIVRSTVLLIANSFGLFLTLVLIDQNLLSGAIFFLSTSIVFALIFATYHLLLLSKFQQERHKEKYKRLHHLMKTIFGDK